VESGSFEITSNVGELALEADGYRHAAANHQPIDVEHPEPDALHVEGGDRTRKRFGLLDERLQLASGIRRFHPGNQGFDPLLRALTMIRRRHPHPAYQKKVGMLKYEG
jgi:hypothetical protein